MVEMYNKLADSHTPTKEEIASLRASVNSYLGIMQHHNTINLRNNVLQNHLSAGWWKHVALKNGKVV